MATCIEPKLIQSWSWMEGGQGRGQEVAGERRRRQTGKPRLIRGVLRCLKWATGLEMGKGVEGSVVDGVANEGERG